MDTNGPGSSTPCGQGPGFGLISSPVSSSTSSHRSHMTASILTAGTSGSVMNASGSRSRTAYITAECSGYGMLSNGSAPGGCVSSLLSPSVSHTMPSTSHEDEQNLGAYVLPSSTTTSDHLMHGSIRDASSPDDRPSTTQGFNSEDSSFDEDKIQQAADSNSSKQPFVECKVCGDKASGYHYGVTSCEGCKGFFRRSIQKKIEYRCLREGKCTVARLNRNRCQYCRFKKCLAAGMSRDSVRYGRVPKRSKGQDDQSVTSSDSILDEMACQKKLLEIYDIILGLSNIHSNYCATTADKIPHIERRQATLMSKINLPSSHLQFSNEEIEVQRLLMWQQLATLVTPSISSIVEFSKRVPSFPDLSQDDQLILIKTGFFEIWLTRMSKMILKEENMIVFEDGSCIARQELAVVYSPDFVTSMFNVAAGFNMLNLTDTEIGIFTAIVLTTSDRQGLSDPQSIERMQDKLVDALKVQIQRCHPTEDNLFPSAIMKLPELRTLGSQHNDLLRWYRMQWHRCNVPQLFAEIFDIQKRVSSEEIT